MTFFYTRGLGDKLGSVNLNMMFTRHNKDFGTWEIEKAKD